MKFQIRETGSYVQDKITQQLTERIESLEQSFSYDASETSIGWSSDCDIDIDKIFKRMEKYFSTIPLDRQQLLKGFDSYSEDIAKICLIYYRVKNYDRINTQPIDFSFGEEIEDDVFHERDYNQAMERVRYLLLETGFTESKNSIILPNFVCDDNYPVTTDMSFLNDILNIIRDINPKARLSVAIGPSIFFDPRRVLDKKDLKDVTCQYDTEIVNVHEQSVHPIRVVEGIVLESVFIPELILESDYLLNLGVLKHNLDTGFTASVKNIMGLLPDFEKLRFHKISYNGIGKAIADLHSIIKPQLNILDAREILLNAQQREYGGIQTNGIGILGSRDALAVDRNALSLARELKLSPNDTYLKFFTG